MSTMVTRIAFIFCCLIPVFSFAADEALVIDAQGKIGIGTSTPKQLMHMIDGNIRMDSPKSSGDVYANPKIFMYNYHTYHPNLLNIRVISGGPFGFEFLRIASPDGEPCQNCPPSSTPRVRLAEISDEGQVRANSFYADHSLSVAQGPVDGYGSLGTIHVWGGRTRGPCCSIPGTPDTTKVSIYASERIVGKDFAQHSDARIKEVIGISDQMSDLKTLNQIEITDYRLQDSKPEAHNIKKVIGQQVRSVFPQAVSISSGTIHDIMLPAEMKGNWVTLDNGNISKGDKLMIRLGGDATEKLYEVLAMDGNAFKLNTSFEGEIFILGREVDDFHYVDYDAIAMLNVSATQALTQKVESLNRQLVAKEERIEQLSQEIKRLNSLQERIEALATLLCSSHPKSAACQ